MGFMTCLGLHSGGQVHDASIFGTMLIMMARSPDNQGRWIPKLKIVLQAGGVDPLIRGSGYVPNLI